MKRLEIEGIDAQTLKDIISATVKNELDLALSKLKPESPDTYLTRDEVCTLLKISSKTLHNWRESKQLIPYSISGRVYYLRSDIDKAMVKLE